MPPTVKRIIGFHCVVNHDRGNTGYVFQVNDNAPDPLIIERFGYGVTIEHTGKRTVVIKHGGINYHAKPGAGDVFFEDVQGDSLVFYKGQHVYMRQLNTEGPKTHIYNKGASLWILGVKTEGRGTVVNTTDGGFTEVLGTLLYPVQPATNGDFPAFISTESNLSAMFRISAYNGNSGYPTLVQETRGGVTKNLTSNSGALLMPLFSGFDSSAASIPFRSNHPSAKNSPLQKWVHFGQVENASGEKWNFLGQYFKPLGD